jgi:6-methylsalicylate decarboxylase
MRSSSRIDVHAHYYPGVYLDLLDRHGGVPAGTEAARALHAGDERDEIAERLAVMDEHGIATQVVSAPAHVGYFDHRQAAIDTARLANDRYAELVANHPGRFAALGTVPLPHVDAALDELARCLDELAMPGIALSSSINGRALSDPAFADVYAELDRRAAILLLHPEIAGAHCPLLAPHNLTRVVGWAVEDAMALLHLYQSGILERHRRLRVISVHLGGFIPFILGALDDRAGRLVPELEPPSLAFRRVFFDTATNAHAPALRLLVEVLGHDRVLLGSDFPFSRGQRFAQEVEAPSKAGLGAEAVVAIERGNAEALFRLTPIR